MGLSHVVGSQGCCHTPDNVRDSAITPKNDVAPAPNSHDAEEHCLETGSELPSALKII